MATEKKVARSFAGKKLFVGIDVHRRTYAVTVVCDEEIVWKAVMPASPQGLIEALSKRFTGAFVDTVYEAGFAGFVLHRALEKAGYQSMVVNPASIPVEANNRVKTDKRDSRKLSFGLSKGDFRGIRIPSLTEELQRVVTRTREQLVEQRTSIMNQVRMKLHQFGLFPLEYTKELSLKDVQGWLKEGGWPLELCSGLQALVAVWAGRKNYFHHRGHREHRESRFLLGFLRFFSVTSVFSVVLEILLSVK
jgi:transposase